MGAARDRESPSSLQGAAVTSVLVTGAGGFIGRRVVGTMRRAGCEVHILVRTMPDRCDAVAIRHDLRLPLRSIPEADWIFHLAGGYAGAEEGAMETDLQMARHILQCGIEAGVRSWILASAAEVYGVVDGIASEETATAPVIPYGRIKLRVEQLFREWLRVVPGCRLVVFRIGEVYGSEGRLITELTRRLKRGFCPWPGRGMVPLSFVHADDVAAAFLCAVQKAPGGVSLYNVADDAAVTWRDFLELVAARCGCSRPRYLPMFLVHAYAAWSRAVARMKGREAIVTRNALRLITTPKLLSNARIKRELGFRPRYANIAEGMEEALGGVSHDA